MLNSYHLQTYFSLLLYLVLATALCILLASLAYLFSLSLTRDHQKASEYECGFEPFDSATRLPFDVHFYLVGILFLIFDVEIALLFPWVLGLKNTGLFGFYGMMLFLLILGLGFFYEWKRGALIWASRPRFQQQDLEMLPNENPHTFSDIISTIVRAYRVFKYYAKIYLCAMALAAFEIYFANKLNYPEYLHSSGAQLFIFQLSMSECLSGGKFQEMFWILTTMYWWMFLSIEVHVAMLLSWWEKQKKAVYVSMVLSWLEKQKKAVYGFLSMIARWLYKLERDGDVLVDKIVRWWKKRKKGALILFPTTCEIIESLVPEMGLTITFLLLLLVVSVLLPYRRKYDLENLARFWFQTVFALLVGIMLTIQQPPTFLINDYLISSSYTAALKLLLIVSTSFILRYSQPFRTQLGRGNVEYPFLMVLALVFMLLLVSSNHLVGAFLTLVGFSLNIYVLILCNTTCAKAREAGIKYYYLSAFNSGLIIYGFFLLFLVAGTGYFHELSLCFAAPLASVPLLQLSILSLLLGFFFKLATAPGHLWAAEIYDGSPDPITGFFMLPVKIAVLGVAVTLLATALDPLMALWQPLLAIATAFSLVIGCFGAFYERRIKRFLAYASINQMGFLLLGLTAGSLEGYRTTVLYLFLYALMNISFLLVFLTAYQEYTQKPLIFLTDFSKWFSASKTENSREWLYGFGFSMTILSMAGIPPLAGFFGKYYLLAHAQEQGLYLLVILGLATSLVSAYYYLRLLKIMWFENNLYRRLQAPMDYTVTKLFYVIEAVLFVFIFYTDFTVTLFDVLTVEVFTL